ncbi:MAG: outer membrane lipoprotein LolB [Pseudomonadota bacterium]|nr:outer membrane lipoprotein LolB [Pseudomonadota bacterium]
MPLATIRLTPPKIDPLRWASLCGLWLLSGCATIAPGFAVTDVEFIVQGKLLLTLADEKTALQFSWQQNQDDYVIDVWGAFGQGRTQLRGTGKKMQVLRGQKVIVAGPPELVMQQQLGWSMPVEAMRYWILGQPQPNIRFADYAIDEAQSSVRFRQSSWAVSVVLVNGANTARQDPQPEQVELIRDDVAVRVKVSKYSRNTR